jgi:transcriptional regulator with XRE-family HTH domain
MALQYIQAPQGDTMNLEDLGNAIKAYRTRLGFTQNDLASALQVSPQAVSKWERGENAPDIATLPELSEILGASVDSLLGVNYRDKRTVEATVVYAEMEGFGPMARDLSPADLAIALNAFFYPLTEHMIARDGVPIKYVGDELFSLFAGEGHRLRAFKAAFAAKEASPRPVRLSVTTGAVWMGSLGHPLYARPDILGEAIYLADPILAWLKQRSPCKVAANAEAVEPVRDALLLGASEPIATWSRKEPVTVWEVKGPA